MSLSGQRRKPLQTKRASQEICLLFARISASSFFNAAIFRRSSSLACFISARSFRAFARLLRRSESVLPGALVGRLSIHRSICSECATTWLRRPGIGRFTGSPFRSQRCTVRMPLSKYSAMAFQPLNITTAILNKKRHDGPVCKPSWFISYLY